ncbi:MAG TPA: glycine--tRNA ligase subunit beta [Candidatus Eisenbacteria bacterium]|nr:glycine--tRNA ligase subunit beta [Candidatus Eisenbacteria bacterium]
MAETLLLEVGCEEIPAGFIAPALQELESLARDGLADARLAHGAVRTLGTPRRLTLIVEGVADRQEDRVKEMTGPAVRVAFDAQGQPTQAAKGFAKSAGIPVESLERVTTPKGEYLLARVNETGAAAADVLPARLASWITSLHFPKTMHWNGPGRFARPVRWIVALLGDRALAVGAFGVVSGRRTRGHRVLAPGWLDLASPAAYAAALEGAGVIVDPDARRAKIRDELAKSAAELKGRSVEDEDLLDEVANLVEWPEAVVGSFEPRYLELPRPVIVASMRAHQRYFAVERPDGTLLPNFVMIRSGRGPGAEEIRRGTQIVLRARLEDARFYWVNDLKGGLEGKLPLLKGIVVHERLGTVHDRTERLVVLVEDLARRLAPKSLTAAARAARLCKADLASEMVRSGKEFASLQGIIGGEYAAASGEPADVAEAIREHYRPEGPSDPIPKTPEGKLVALADKIEATTGGLRAGLEVSGSQDPFGLRRAGNGIVRILVESGWRLDVLDAAHFMERLYDSAGVPPGDPERFAEFWKQRVASALEVYGISSETAGAVLAVRPGDPIDVLARARAIEEIRKSPDFEGLMIGYRRAANILRTAPPADINAPGQPMAERAEAFGERAEADLHLETKMARQAVETYLKGALPDYGTVLRHLLGLRPSIDRFFDAVMVMVDDPVARKRRLGLLEAVRQTFLRIADFSLLPSAPGQKSN